jgi:hypothetical protein
MRNVGEFLYAGNSRFGVLNGSAKDLDTLRWIDEVNGWVVRTVRGEKMRTWSAFYDEFIAAYQLPWFFGRNLDAFNDSMTDLGWLGSDDENFPGHLLLIRNASNLLADESSQELEAFIRILRVVIADWNIPGSFNTPRDNVPFVVVLQSESREETERMIEKWGTVGAELERLSF